MEGSQKKNLLWDRHEYTFEGNEISGEDNPKEGEKNCHLIKKEVNKDVKT